MINCYEDEEHIVADFMLYENAAILDKWDMRLMRDNIYDENNQAVPFRFVLPLHSEHVSVQLKQSIVLLP